MPQAYGNPGRTETVRGLVWIRSLARAVGAALLAERERWILWLPVGLGFGIAAYFALPLEPAAGWGAAAVIVVLLCSWLVRRNGPLLGLSLCLLAMFSGFCLAQVRTALVAAPVLTEKTPPVLLEVRVLRVEEYQSRYRLLLEQPVLVPEQGKRLRRELVESFPRLERVRLSVASKRQAIAPGDWLRLRAVLRPPSPPAAPGGYDFARRAYFERIGAVGYTLGTPRIVEPPAGLRAPPGLFAALAADWEGLRQAISRHLRDSIGGQEGAVAAALIVGDRSGLSEETTQNLRDSGLAHLLAISGLHLGLMSGSFFFALRFVLALIPALALAYPIKKWAAFGALIVALVYMLLAGATVPAQRAFLMISVVFIAIMLDRNAISLRLVAWAAVALLLFRPELLLSVSFQLSFAAVACLVSFYEWYAARRGAADRAGWLGPGEGGLLRRSTSYLGNVGIATVIATFATTPFAVYHFNRLAWFGLLANLVAVPITALWVMPLALSALLLMPLGLDGPSLFLMGVGIGVLLDVAREVAAWPGAVSLVPPISGWGFALLCIGGLWLVIWQRHWRLIGLPLIVAGWSSLALHDPPDAMISHEAGLIALRSPSGHYHFNRDRGGRFVRESWLRGQGERADGTPRASFGEMEEAWLACDTLGCRASIAGKHLALIDHPVAFLEDCRRNDVIVAFVPAPAGCGAGRIKPPLIIDGALLERAQALSLWLVPDEIRMRSVSAASGSRPWVWWLSR